MQDTGQVCLKKPNLTVLYQVRHLVNHLKKNSAKSGAKSKSDFNYDSNYKFYKFFKGYDEFKEMPLDSNYNRIKEFNKLLTNIKTLRPKKPKTQLKNERIIKNVVEFYEKYYDAYKNDYDTDDELNEAKKKIFDYKQFGLFDKQIKRQKQMEKQKILKIEKRC